MSQDENDLEHEATAAPHGTEAEEAAAFDPPPTPEVTVVPVPVVAPLVLPAAPEGIDLYSGDGPVNWVDVRRGGKSFAIVKATEGLSGVDEGFAERFAAMVPAGLVRGAYHFLRPNMNGLAQAQHFLDVVGAALKAHPELGGPALLCVDVERMDGETPDTVAECVRAFCSHVAEVTTFFPIVYTSARFVAEDMKGVPFGVAGLGGDHGCPLWVVWWQKGKPKLPPEWDDYLIQQRAGDSREVHGAHQADLDSWHVLALGATGSGVRFIQQQLGVVVTGTFDAATDAAVRKFQAAHGLTVDGRVGPVSWVAIAWSRA